MELDDASCSSAINLPESLKIPQNDKVSDFPPALTYQFSGPKEQKVLGKKIFRCSSRKLRKMKRAEPTRPSDIIQCIKNLSLDCDGTTKTSAFEFQKREMTTIHEESFHYRKKIFKSKYRIGCITCHKIAAKEYKEKVASLKAIVSRLQNYSTLAKPEEIQSHIPDETIQLFQKFHI